MAQLKDTTINGDLHVTGNIYQNSNKKVPLVTLSNLGIGSSTPETALTLATSGTPIDTLRIATNNYGTSGNMTRVLYIWTE